MNATTAPGISCKNGTPHRHATVAEGRACWLDRYAREGRAPAPKTNPLTEAVKTENARRRAEAAAVPAGRYAVDTSEGLRFYQVDRPTEGQWAGFTFVSRLSGPDALPVKDAKARTQVLFLIAMDVKAATLRYGKEIGSCGICGVRLTTKESRDFGIGPKCRKRLGW